MTKTKARNPDSRERSALLVIDVQQGFDDGEHWGSRNNPGAEERISELLEDWRTRGEPVIHVQHLSSDPDSPLHPGKPGVEFKSVARPLPGEWIVTKQVNSAFVGTDLHAYLQERGIRTLIVVGLTTDHCVSTTARMADNFGYQVYVVRDATATFDRRGPEGGHFTAELMHETALVSLHGEFARVVSTKEVLDGG